MSVRAFVRGLKSAQINTDTDLLEYMRPFTENIRKTGVRTLEGYIITLINGDINDTTLIELFKVLNTLIPKIASDSLIQNTYYKIRQAVIEKYGRDTAMHKKSLSVMRFDQAKWKANRAAYNKKVAEKNHNPVQYDFTQIKDIVMDIYESDDVAALGVLLQLCSGGRIGEILYRSTFEKVKEQPHYIKQVGILKSKTLTEVVKPILFLSVSYFLRVFRGFRKCLAEKGITDAETSASLTSLINTRVKRLFNNSNVHSHDLRKIYADIAFQTFANKQKDTAYISSVLGHDRHNVQVSTSYLTLSVQMDSNDKSFVQSNIEPAKPVVVPVNDKSIRDGRVFERMAQTIAAMEANGEKVTSRSLAKYNYGMRSIMQYLKSLKA